MLECPQKLNTGIVFINGTITVHLVSLEQKDDQTRSLISLHFSDLPHKARLNPSWEASPSHKGYYRVSAASSGLVTTRAWCSGTQPQLADDKGYNAVRFICSAAQPASLLPAVKHICCLALLCLLYQTLLIVAIKLWHLWQKRTCFHKYERPQQEKVSYRLTRLWDWAAVTFT